MIDATQFLVAVPQAQAEAARQAAATWDAEGAASMFRNPTLHPTGEAAALYVFSYGWIGNAHLPAIEIAAAAFPGGNVVTADTFEAALSAAGLDRVSNGDLPPGR